MPRIKGSVINRRTVVGGLFASGLLSALSFAAVRKLQDSADALSAGSLTQTTTSTTTSGTLATSEMDRWLKMVGTDFTSGTFRLRLQGVRALNSSGVRPDACRDGAFLCAFDVLAGGYMPGDLIYRMTSRNQVLDIFLANVFTREFPTRMHAVFN